MISSGERSYAYAKACGIIGKSFVGSRIRSLRNINRLSELDALVFGRHTVELPEKELLLGMEDRFIKRSEKAINSILRSFSNPPRLLTLAAKPFDNKETFNNEQENEQENDEPRRRAAGYRRSVRNGFYAGLIPGISSNNLEDTPQRGGVLNPLANKEQEESPDRIYYTQLWNSLKELNKNDCRAAKKILSEEIALRNCAWVLRLRTYYNLRPFEIEPYLVEIKEEKQLCSDALEALDFLLDDYNDWENWKRRGFLNPPSFSGEWRACPRHFQNAAAQYLYHLALHHFRRRPSSIDTIFCFIKLKQFEEDILTSHAEGLGMGMNGNEVQSMLELSV